jgi:hypothetical protein
MQIEGTNENLIPSKVVLFQEIFIDVNAIDN